MTPDDHNKTLGILHVIYGALHTVLLVVGFFAMSGVIYTITHEPGRAAPPFTFFLIVIGVACLLSLLFMIPALVAGYGLLKRRRWARTAGIVAAILMALNFPLGTALAVYTFWFLNGRGAPLHAGLAAGHTPYSLGGAQPSDAAGWFTAEREREYVPPREPPDWR
jgi:hypothetical protein